LAARGSSAFLGHVDISEWPADFDKPGDTTLKTWLGRAVERGIIVCEGTGRNADPYRYFLRETKRNGVKRWAPRCTT
jgi:hypothetical protein